MGFRVKFIIITAILCLGFSIMAITNAPKNSANSNEQISVVRAIDVSSNVTNVLSQTYNSTVTGKIKNNTNNALNNIVLRVKVKTDFLQHTGTLTINISTIPAKEEYSISEIFSTTENFETVTTVECQINGLGFAGINNNLDEATSWQWYLTLAIVSGVLFLIALLPIILVAHQERVEEREREEEARAIKLQEMKQTMLEQQKLENEKKKIELELQQVNLGIKRAKLEQQKLESNKPIYCPYCGSKNDPEDKKCHTCGANM